MDQKMGRRQLVVPSLPPMPSPIALVSNGAGLLHSRLGPTIDAFPLICRFNHYRLGPQWSADVGTRTTHHAFWIGADPLPTFHPSHTHLINPAPYDKNVLNTLRRLSLPSTAQLIPQTLYHYAETTLRLPGPTTGALAALHLVNEGYHPHLFHFDHLATGHYWNLRHRHTLASHTPSAERNLLTRLHHLGALTLHPSPGA